MDLERIEAVFRQMGIIGSGSMQFYDPSHEYRKGYLIKDGGRVYVNVPAGKLNKWHMNLLERKKLAPFIEEHKEAGMVRIGFNIS